ncbi:class I SAM-dependent methyltransferase [Jeotgalibacillus proteolyticus]|uniref:Class I SAM-dependent methyltransferase n=1 Tax=Jeotgalibacillus proteolyticus TaxID=2082395 RepID=A0A2S5G7A0_9BACL|nr:class I SAM-dependent methyltransferase [Jeotgalibacillus proteolyticus]PPA68859.1 class I SAM-dependent methyltransferase [Jeotgalibacillus proteolyticus]
MITELKNMWKARIWMKTNVPFLYSWHAYVGFDLNLFEAFKRPMRVEDVADAYDLEFELLEQWAEVGVALKHLKRDDKGRISVKKQWKLPGAKKDSPSSGDLLKEMMELHIPSLLSYPGLMKEKKRQHFDNEEHGSTVARTSTLLELLAFHLIQRNVKKHSIQSILDIGCGEAGYLKRLAKKHPDLTLKGVEINEEVAKRAQKATESFENIEIIHSDIDDYQPDNRIDYIMINNLLHYVDPDERLDFFNRVNEVMSDNGIATIISPLQKARHGKQFSSAFNSFFLTFDNLYPIPSEDELEEIANEAGFTMEKPTALIREGGWFIVKFKKTS